MKKGYKHYTKEEVEFLTNNHKDFSYKELGQRLRRTPSNIYHKLRRLGLIEKTGRRKLGRLNGNWKGGISYLKSGYIRDNVVGKNVHSLVMEQLIGREIKHPEIIHHIDGNKANNDLQNLFLCRDAQHHRYLHASLEKVAFQLVQSGIILFDAESESYYVNQNFEQSLKAFGYDPK